MELVHANYEVSDEQKKMFAKKELGSCLPEKNIAEGLKKQDGKVL